MLLVGQLEYTIVLILSQYPQSLNIAISLNITIGLLLTEIIVILRLDCTSTYSIPYMSSDLKGTAAFVLSAFAAEAQRSAAQRRAKHSTAELSFPPRPTSPATTIHYEQAAWLCSETRNSTFSFYYDISLVLFPVNQLLKTTRISYCI